MTRQYVQNARIYVNSAGSDSNDGSSGQPLQTIAAAVSALYSGIDCGGTQPEILLQTDMTLTSAIGIYGQLVGTNFFKISGDGAQRKIYAASNAQCIFQAGDGAQFGVDNVELDTSTSTVPCVALYGHQYGVMDTFNNVSIKSKAGDQNILTDYETHVNILGGLTFKGARSRVFYLGPMSVLNYNGSFAAASGASCSEEFFNLRPNAFAELQGNVSFSGSWSGAAKKHDIQPNATLRNSSGATIPGAAGVVSTVTVGTIVIPTGNYTTS